VVHVVRQFLFLLACLSFGGLAKADTLNLTVSAIILPRVSVQVLASPPALQVTERDVAKGYVDAPVPLSLLVSSNTSRGVLLMFTSGSELVTHTRVSGPQGDVQLGSAGGAVWVRDAQPRLHLALQFRFYLSAETAPGHYAWPLHVAAES